MQTTACPLTHWISWKMSCSHREISGWCTGFLTLKYYSSSPRRKEVRDDTESTLELACGDYLLCCCDQPGHHCITRHRGAANPCDVVSLCLSRHGACALLPYQGGRHNMDACFCIECFH